MVTAYREPLLPTATDLYPRWRRLGSNVTGLSAASAELAFGQLVLLVKESPAAKDLSRADILQLLHRVIDVVVQFELMHGQRVVTEMCYQGISTGSD